MNALKSGLHAQSHIIRGEDPAALAQLAAEYNAEFQPVTPRQRDLVDTLVHNEWKIRRLRAIETDLWEYSFNQNDAIYDNPNDRVDIRRRKHALRTAFADLEDRLERLQRRLHAYERSTARTLKQLRELIAAEHAQPVPEATEPLPQPIEEPALSSRIGFVPSILPEASPGPDPGPPIPAERGGALLP